MVEQLALITEKLPDLVEISINAVETAVVVTRSADAVTLIWFTTSEWAAIGQMIGGLSSLGLLIFAWWQIRATVDQAQRQIQTAFAQTQTEVKSAFEQAKMQIDSAFQQAKIWRTLEVCEKYDADPTIDGACRNLRRIDDQALRDLATQKNLGTYFADIATILNYLDGIGVGITQNLYDKDIVYDHIREIILHHSKRFLNESDGNLYVERKHYEKLIWLTREFETRDLQKPQTVFKS